MLELIHTLFSAVEVLLFSSVSNRLRMELSGKVWLYYAGLGLIAMVIDASLFQLGIMWCGAVKSSMLSTVEPVTGVLIGMFAFREKVSA